MVDLQTFRSRIGGFISKHFPYYGLGRLSSYIHGHEGMRSFGYCLVFIIVVGLSSHCSINDPSIEENPGPSRSRVKHIPYDSEAQNKAFNTIRDTNRDIANVSSTHYFLKFCQNLNILPRGFEPTKLSIATIKPTKAFLDNLSELDNSNAKTKLEAHTKFYQSLLTDLVRRRTSELSILSTECTPQKFEFLTDLLLSFLESDKDKYMKVKEQKLNTLLDVHQDQLKSNEEWIRSLGLTIKEKSYINNNEQICDAIINASMQLLRKEKPYVLFQSTSLPHSLLEYSPNETIHIHHNGHGHFCTSTSIGNKVRIYDSLNMEPTDDVKLQVATLYSPDPAITPTIERAVIVSQQKGGVDCGIFCIAYATDLLYGEDPAKIHYDQEKMRPHLIKCLEDNSLTPFPRASHTFVPTNYIDVTANVPDTEKWTIPKKSAQSKPCQNNTQIHFQNKFSPLNQPDKINPRLPNIKPKDNQIPHSTSGPKPQTMNRRQNVNPQKYMSIQHPKNKSKPTIKKDSIICNLSSYKLSEVEKSVLELGLSFSPSTFNIDKEQIATDMYQFIRKLKLREFFSTNTTHEPTSIESPNNDNINTTPENTDRCPLKWKDKNPDWYPDDVRNNRSEGLTKWITDIETNFNSSLKNNETKYWNNLTNDQRKALKGLANNKSITIKPADKGGALVIMNTKEYEAECMKQLSDTNFYEELSTNPNETYKNDVRNAITDLEQAGYLNKLEKKMLKKGARTPLFYGLPKIHNPFTKFPELRPICSGTDSSTFTLSEFLDSFLKAASRKTKSFIRYSTDFICKTKDTLIPKNYFLVTLDVKSLYPNIDQEEGAEACAEALNTRTNQSIPTAILKRLILLVLRSNTLQFGLRFFHQIKGTAMGTPFAVNFANLFMNKFETEMLNAYEAIHQERPMLWLRFVDDIFFVWTHSETSLNRFISFCDSYSSDQSMASTIKFKHRISQSSVEFLDMQITLDKGHLTTSLYGKPIDTHTYLHSTSFHAPSTLLSLPKTQFIRLRRLCSSLSDYKVQADKFVSFFQKRGFNVKKLLKTALEVQNLERESLLQPKHHQNHQDYPESVVLSLTWHPKLQFAQSLVKKTYDKFINLYPTLKNTFPARPIVAFRRTKNLKDILVRARTTPVFSPPNLPKQTASFLQPCMNTTNQITNQTNKITMNISGGSATDKNVVYAAECLKHKCLYVGVTKLQLNERFNIHRSDITNYPDRCELPGHFHKYECDFDKDLRVSILQQNVVGSRTFRELQEDKWICKLQTISPNGMNMKLHDYGKTFQNIFK